MTRSGADGLGWMTPIRARMPTIARTTSSSQPACRASCSSGTSNFVACVPAIARSPPPPDAPVSARATALSAGSSTVARSMKNTCRPLSRADANSRQRAGRPVAAGAAGLLVVRLDRAGDRLVADGPHVRLVDAHAERVRGHDDVDVTGHEAPLRLRAHLARQPRVVREHRRAELLRQPARELVALRARARVDDRGQRPRLGERCRDPAVAGLLRRARDDGEREVRPVEPGRDPDRVAQAQPATMSSATCGVAVAVEATIASRAEPARGVGEPEVVRAEVVAPLRDAVRLVDHEQPDLGVADALEEAGRGEALGRDVEQPRRAGHRAVDRRAVRRRRPAAR